MSQRRIMIFGRPGSGKSTFAHALAAKTGLPLYHLDKIFFVSGWIERDYQEFMGIQEEVTQGGSWIIDGNSIRSLETRWKYADVVLYFNFSKITCFFRLIKRLIFKSDHIDDRADNCPEVVTWKLIRYMWTFERRVSGIIAELQAKYPCANFVEIRNQKQLQDVSNMVVTHVCNDDEIE